MRRTYRTLNDYEMQHNAEVGLFTRPSILLSNNRVIINNNKKVAAILSFGFVKHSPTINLGFPANIFLDTQLPVWHLKTIHNRSWGKDFPN
jgi:hypothetical protein